MIEARYSKRSVVKRYPWSGIIPKRILLAHREVTSHFSSNELLTRSLILHRDRRRFRRSRMPEQGAETLLSSLFQLIHLTMTMFPPLTCRTSSSATYAAPWSESFRN